MKIRLLAEQDGNYTPFEGSVALKDESFVMLKTGRETVKIISWQHIVPSSIKRIYKNKPMPISVEKFKTIRE